MVYSYRDFLPELELFALMVACLCHDVDHRGRNNSYQVQYSASPILRLSLFISIAFYYNLPTSSIFIFYLVIYILLQVAAQTSLADLYGTSATMEQHHFSYTVHILNTEGHNIFSNLSPKNYKKILKSIEVITQSICNYIHLYLSISHSPTLFKISQTCILATDLASVPKTREEFKKLVETGTFDKDNKGNLLLISLSHIEYEALPNLIHYDSI